MLRPARNLSQGALTVAVSYSICIIRDDVTALNFDLRSVFDMQLFTSMDVVTLAGGQGNSEQGYADGRGKAALFRTPHGVALSLDSTFALVVSKSGCNEMFMKNLTESNPVPTRFRPRRIVRIT